MFKDLLPQKTQKLYKKNTKICFKDVAGLSEVKKEMSEFVQFL